MRREACIAMLLASVSLATYAAEPTPKKPTPVNKPTQPDIKFLEYLGTLEGDNENWTDIAGDALPASKRKENAKAETAAKNATGKK